ncbi:hypothetical protein HNQ56_004814 [Anaerotaenia torta]|uniref:extracellular solute-binding protein n=1 Tax=Anaerotaenia torta TaxID=433293 RepID=UPI003D1DE0D7
MKKRIIAILISAVMVMSFTACAGNEGSNETTPPATSTPAAATPTTEPEPTATPEPEPTYDFNGITLRIGWYNANGAPNPDADAMSEAYYNRIKFVEDNYNCKVEYVDCTGSYYDKYVTSVLAGEPIVDIAYMMTYHVPSLAEGGIIQPLNNYSSFDENDFIWRPDVTEAGYYNNNYYVTLRKNYEVRYGIFWNKTLFEKYNLPNLFDLAAKGEWTWDKFKEIAIAGNQDTDNDGTIDIYGFNARESLEWNYMYSNGANVVAKTNTGMEIDLSDPKVIEALTALQDFTTTVKFRNAIDWSIESWDSFIKDFRDGKYLMCLEESWIAGSYLDVAEGGMIDEWGWVPFPKGPSATDYSCYGKEFGAWGMLNGIENAEEKAQIYNLINHFTETADELNELVDAQLENWARDAESFKNAKYILEEGVSVVNPINGFNDIKTVMGNLFQEITSGSTTPQTAIETYQSQIDTAIADIKTHDYDADMQAVVDRVKAEEEKAASENTENGD